MTYHRWIDPGAADEVEDATVTVLPDELVLASGIRVQPDATVVAPGSYILVEAKRMRSSSFQSEQLAREYLSVLLGANGRLPLLLLVLGDSPLVAVKGVGRMSAAKAVAVNLESLLDRVGTESGTMAELVQRIPEVLAWTTWSAIHEITVEQVKKFSGSEGADAAVRRMCAALTRSIDWHR